MFPRVPENTPRPERQPFRSRVPSLAERHFDNTSGFRRHLPPVSARICFKIGVHPLRLNVVAAYD